MTEDLHAWSIYRQNLNTDFADSQGGQQDRPPLPYGNFLLKEATVQAILNNPRLVLSLGFWRRIIDWWT